METNAMTRATKTGDVLVERQTVLHDGKLKLIELEYRVRGFNGREVDSAREIVARQDAAAALVHDLERDVIVLCEQFRPAAYMAGDGWLLELPAGKVDDGETPQACIARELEEEIGYRVRDLQPIGAYFSTPGYSTERVHLFYAPVVGADLIRPEAHGVDQGEDIRRVELSLQSFLEQLRGGAFADGKIVSTGAWALSRWRR
jgi:ADP-ribose pyrophosphatase